MLVVLGGRRAASVGGGRGARAVPLGGASAVEGLVHPRRVPPALVAADDMGSADRTARAGAAEPPRCRGVGAPSGLAVCGLRGRATVDGEWRCGRCGQTIIGRRGSPSLAAVGPHQPLGGATRRRTPLSSRRRVCGGPAWRPPGAAAPLVLPAGGNVNSHPRHRSGTLAGCVDATPTGGGGVRCVSRAHRRTCLGVGVYPCMHCECDCVCGTGSGCARGGQTPRHSARGREHRRGHGE